VSQSPERALRILSVTCGVLAVLVALAGHVYGKLNRFDHWITEGIEYENVKVAAALSDVVYGLNTGGLAQVQVYNTLREAGFTIYPELLARVGETYPHNMSNAALLNDGLRRASSLKDLVKERHVIVHMKPVEPNDLGLIEYYKIAFRLFGIEIQSFFSLYTL